MKNILIYLYLISLILSSCTQKERNEDEIFRNSDNGITYDSQSGEPFTGVTFNRNGPFEHSKIIKSTYDDGKLIETMWMDSREQVRAMFKYDKEGVNVGKIYYDEEGHVMSEYDFISRYNRR